MFILGFPIKNTLIKKLILNLAIFFTLIILISFFYFWDKSNQEFFDLKHYIFLFYQ